MKTLTTIALFALASLSISLYAADETRSTSGTVRTCVAGYTAGFVDYREIKGYCIRKVQFASEHSATAKELVGKFAELEYTPSFNDPGCSLIDFPMHPIACTTKMVGEVVSLKVDGEIVMGK